MEKVGEMTVNDSNPIRLRLADATIGFDAGSPLIEGVDLTIRAGEIVGLTGRSGIGKTTLLRTAAGLVSPLGGSVECCCTADTRADKGAIGLIPQKLGLVQHQTVGYNVLMGALAEASFLQTAFSLPSKRMREETRAVIEEVGLAEKTLESVNRLSGGQQRRVLSRARCCKNRICFSPMSASANSMRRLHEASSTSSATWLKTTEWRFSSSITIQSEPRHSVTASTN